MPYEVTGLGSTSKMAKVSGTLLGHVPNLFVLQW